MPPLSLGAPEPSVRAARYSDSPTNKRFKPMPVLLWILGVPLSVVLLLMLFGAV